MKLSENDYRSSEAEGMLNVAIVVSDASDQEFGDLLFNVTALTKQQFNEFGSQLCNNGLVLQTSSSTRPAEGKQAATVIIVNLLACLHVPFFLFL